ncbi:MAG TPA: phasin family protein [Allosphingosinicella sp.]|nr:phasin family protein [Allosphingosinicella sp.]
MADQAVETKVNETRADTPRIADAVKAPVAEAAKAEPAKAEPVKPAEPKPAAPVKAAAKPTPRAKPARKPATARKAKAKAKPARAAAKAARIAKPAIVAAKIAKITKKPARAGVKAIKTGVKTMNKQTQKAADAGFAAAEQIKTVVSQANDRAKTAMEKSAKVIEELAELGRGNVEAIVASSKVAAKGVEGLSQDAANYSRKSFEDASAAFKSFAEVKSATDLFKLQGDFARSAFDAAVAQSARVSETVLKLAGDVAEPLTSRYTVAAERVKTLAA